MSFGDTSDDTSSEQEISYKKAKTVQEKSLTLYKPINDREIAESPVIKGKNKSKEHKCVETGCHAVFTRPYRLRDHILSQHSGEKPFKCSLNECSKSYSNSSHLRRHVLSAHLDEGDHSKEVICGVDNCGLICANKFSLKRHIARFHTDLPFQCETCHEKFHRKSELNVHKTQVHNEAVPYKCSKCSHTFIHYHLYQKHISRHKTYQCDCEESFEKWTEYLKHKKTQCTIPKTKYECAICGKTFDAKTNLAQHCLKVHVRDSQAENFKCTYLDCTRSYKYKRNLNIHIKTFHEKVFEYFKCPQKNCQVILKTKKNVKQHLKVCNTPKPLSKKVRKPRKDKGIIRKSTASELSGLKVDLSENQKNINNLFVDKPLNEDTYPTNSGSEDSSDILCCKKNNLKESDIHKINSASQVIRKSLESENGPTNTGNVDGMDKAQSNNSEASVQIIQFDVPEFCHINSNDVAVAGLVNT